MQMKGVKIVIEKTIIPRLILPIMLLVNIISPGHKEIELSENTYVNHHYQSIFENKEVEAFNELIDKKITEEIMRTSKPKTERIQMVSVGDIMCHSPQFKSVYSNGNYDFTSWFESIKEYIENGDIAIANLETTFSGAEKKYSGYPCFNTPKELGIALKETGFDILSTANNHSLDRGNYGIVNTLNELDKIGLQHTGTYRNKEDRYEILIKDVKGIKIAFMSYTYGTNGISMPKKNPNAVNIINKEKMLKDIERARQQEVDLIVFSLHFGQEYQRRQNKNQEKLVEYLFVNGVDIVLGSHPHVIQPLDFKEIERTNGEKKNCFAIYSQGNFISNQRKRYTDSGLITLIDIEKNFKTNETKILDFSFIPTWVDRSNSKNGVDFRILPVENAIKNYGLQSDDLINEHDYRRLKEVLSETTEQISY